MRILQQEQNRKLTSSQTVHKSSYKANPNIYLYVLNFHPSASTKSSKFNMYLFQLICYLTFHQFISVINQKYICYCFNSFSSLLFPEFSPATFNIPPFTACLLFTCQLFISIILFPFFIHSLFLFFNQLSYLRYLFNFSTYVYSISQYSLKFDILFLVIIMLPKKLSLVSPYQSITTQSSASLSSNPDLFICIEGLVIPLQRKKLEQSNWIRNASPQKQILVPTQSLNAKILESVIAYYYGWNIEVADAISLTYLFQILKYMGLRVLQKELEKQLICEVKQFDTFFLLEIALKAELQELTLICFQYLEIEEFEQVKYAQYTLLNCDFKLFQIILRKHHVLKMKKKIQGITPENIQELIHLYCKRHHYPKEILQRLLEKYVFPWRIQSVEQSKIKNSLRLHKLPFKNLGQSTTIYGNDSQKREKQFEEVTGVHKNKDIKIDRPQSNPVRMRKYSMQMDKILVQMGLNANLKKIGADNFPSSQKVIRVEEVITEEQQYLTEYLNALYIGDRELKNTKYLQNFEEEISQIGNKGSIELKILDIQQQIVKKPNTKSMMFQDVIQQSIEESIEQRSRKNTNFFPKNPIKPAYGKKY